jgi:DNA modification methylase
VRSFQNLAAVLPGGGAVYVCGAVSTFVPYVHAFEAADLRLSSVIVWDKTSLTLSMKDYHPQYELVFYGWPQGKPHYFGGGRSQSDIWEIHREDGHSYLHPTQKPVELVQRAIQNSARPGQTVLDVFLGSGTTVIACEKSGRRCLGLEIDPLFCEVALARWERLTRERARRAD